MTRYSKNDESHYHTVGSAASLVTLQLTAYQLRT